MKRVGIIGAMNSEIALLREKMREAREERAAKLTLYVGKLGNCEVVLVRCGVGKVSAALCTQLLVDRYGVEAIINTGIAGGLASGLAVGDMVLATDLIQHDMNLKAFGYVRGFQSGMGDGRSATRFMTDPALRALCRAAADEVLIPTGHKCVEGTIVSGDIFVDDAVLKRKLRDRFNAAAAEMEGAAIAQVATQNEVPCIVVRAVSDLAEGGAAYTTYEEFEEEMAALAATITCRLLERL